MQKKILALLLISILPTFCFAKTPYSKKEPVKQFINYMHKHHKYNKDDLLKIFDNIYKDQSIIDKISRPAEYLPWSGYKRLFLTKNRVDKGVEFWNKHKADLIKAEKEYGVPPEIIVAIIGVETLYGINKGTYPVLTSLSTLAFDYPKRSKFFKKELEEFLLLTKEEKLNPTSIKGSYAGAIGLPQFISSSYRNYAVDFNKKGNKDLINDPTCAIGSVANYFKRHGWTKGLPIAQPAKVEGNKYSKLVRHTGRSHTPTPTLSVSDLESHDIFPTTPIRNKDGLFALIDIGDDKKVEPWIATNNFYVITRYNHSTNYAMAVYQLSESIKARYRKTYNLRESI